MTKSKTATQAHTATDPATDDPAQQIWLAGLGAVTQAQKQGSRALQKMLQDGLDLQRQAQQGAEHKITEATAKMGALARQLARGQVLPGAASVQHTPWGGLHGLFEQRVSAALQQLGWPTLAQFQQLEQRITALEHALARPDAAPTRAAAKPAKPAKPAPRNRPAPRATTKKAAPKVRRPTAISSRPVRNG